MYEDEKYSINWLKIILRVLIAFLVVLITIKLIMMINNNRKKETSNNNEYATKENLQLMDNYVKKAYPKEKIPEAAGSSVNESLQFIIDNGGLEELKGLKDHCDLEHSYVEVVRLDDEIQYTSYLTCKNGDEKDTVVSHVSLEEKDDKTTTTTAKNGKTTKTTKENTTKKTTESTTKKSTTKVSTTARTTKQTTKKTTKKTTTKKYTVSYNSNGGGYITPQKVNAGGTVKLPTPKREGYRFIGWYYHGNRVNNNTKINSNMVLVARWELA